MKPGRRSPRQLAGNKSNLIADEPVRVPGRYDRRAGRPDAWGVTPTRP